MSTPTPGANLFGSQGFWAFAIIISILWGVTTCTSTQNKEADANKESERARSLATESSAVWTCRTWMLDLYGMNDDNFSIVRTDITRRGSLDYRMDVTFESTAPISKKIFTRTESCQVVWDHSNDKWKIRAR